MKEDKCIFCYENIPKEEIFYEDNLFYSRLDRFPGGPGHIEIIPKRHVQYLFDLNNEEKKQYLFSIENTWSKLKLTNLEKEYLNMIPVNETSKKSIEQALQIYRLNERIFPIDSLQGVNNGPDAGQSIHHLHWHIIPAFPNLIIPRGIMNSVEGYIDYTK
ncbi:HIT domain-containing protein [archaeon]|nr:HIT domain-containing protein [archaeon]